MNANQTPPDGLHLIQCPHCGGGIGLATHRAGGRGLELPPGPGFPSDLVDTEEALQMLGNVSRETLNEVVDSGGVTQYRVTPRVVRYSRADIYRFLTTTAAEAGRAACERKVANRRARPRR